MMTASQMGKKGGKISSQNRLKNKSKEEISKIMRGVRLMKSRTEKWFTEPMYLENDGVYYRSEPAGEKINEYINTKSGEKKLEPGNPGMSEALRFGNEITKEDYRKL